MCFFSPSPFFAWLALGCKVLAFSLMSNRCFHLHALGVGSEGFAMEHEKSKGHKLHLFHWAKAGSVQWRLHLPHCGKLCGQRGVSTNVGHLPFIGNSLKNPFSSWAKIEVAKEHQMCGCISRSCWNEIQMCKYLSSSLGFFWCEMGAVWDGKSVYTSGRKLMWLLSS